jgi:hypothetical protein
MAKVIIGIHGLGNKPDKETLSIWWKSALLEGFQKQGLKVPKFKFELVYWADLFYDQTLSQGVKDTDSPYYLSEAYLPSPSTPPEKKDLGFRRKFLEFIQNQLDSIFLNDDFTLNYQSVSDAIIHKYFKELEIYYGKEDDQIRLKQQSRKRLLDMLNKYKYDDILLIGHSMGSIIAYDVLQFESEVPKIHSFFSIGAPLGLPFIRAKIANEMKEAGLSIELSTPECIQKSWHNFADLEDKVAIDFRLRRSFSASSNNIYVIDHEVINDYKNGNEQNPHKSFGYLRTSIFAQGLAAFLNEKKAFSLKNSLQFFQKIGHKFKNRLFK